MRMNYYQRLRFFRRNNRKYFQGGKQDIVWICYWPEFVHPTAEKKEEAK